MGKGWLRQTTTDPLAKGQTRVKEAQCNNRLQMKEEEEEEVTVGRSGKARNY